MDPKKKVHFSIQHELDLTDGMEQDVSHQKKWGNHRRYQGILIIQKWLLQWHLQTVPQYKDATCEMSFFSSFDKQRETSVVSSPILPSYYSNFTPTHLHVLTTFTPPPLLNLTRSLHQRKTATCKCVFLRQPPTLFCKKKKKQLTWNIVFFAVRRETWQTFGGAH